MTTRFILSFELDDPAEVGPTLFALASVGFTPSVKVITDDPDDDAVDPPTTTDARDVRALGYACPRCGADVDEWCVRPTGESYDHRFMHEARTNLTWPVQG